MLLFQESKKYAGLIISSALARLAREYSSALEISLSPQEEQPHAASRKGARAKSSKTPTSESHTARVVVYGMRDEAAEIARLLSDAGLFLQQPHPGECGSASEYFNPHLLIRPGAQMPKIKPSIVSSQPTQKTAPSDVDEAMKSEFTRIFDSATCGEVVGHQPSGRLLASLKP